MLAKFLQLAVLASSAFVATQAGHLKGEDYNPAEPDELKVGEYFRPSEDEVSGDPLVEAKYLRSPCPALNTLANHGFLPRDGRNLTPAMLREAVMKVLNIGLDRALSQTQGLDPVLTLADLSEHNFIEHDVSLVHADVEFGWDPAHVDKVLAQDLLDRAVDGFIGVDEVAGALADRITWCFDENANCTFEARQQAITFSEAAGFLQVFGANGDATISVDHAESFMVHERIPEGWTKSPRTLMLKELQTIGNNVRDATAAILDAA